MKDLGSHGPRCSSSQVTQGSGARTDGSEIDWYDLDSTRFQIPDSPTMVLLNVQPGMAVACCSASLRNKAVEDNPQAIS